VLQGNKELLPFDAGRRKEDYRANTIDRCGSRAGFRSRDRNGIPLRPNLREASKDREVTALLGLPLRREDREDRYRLQGVYRIDRFYYYTYCS
jgi:hypothetical protein